MRTIRLYGSLAKFLGRRKIRADVASASEAVRCLLGNFPELEAHMSDKHYKVRVGTYHLEDLEELQNPSSAKEDIAFIPVISGAGGSAGKIFAGIGIVALSLFLGPGGFLASQAFTLGSAAVTAGVGIGASLILGGVAQLLTPVPAKDVGPDSESDPRRSYSFSGVQNTSRQGIALPVVYGEVLVGSIVISAGIDITQVSV